MKTLIILRALPGAGKSTLCKKLEEDYGCSAVICSADDFWYFGKEKIIENYKFDIARIGESHGSCFGKFKRAVETNQPLVVIDNTNIELRDFKNYIKVVKGTDYKIAIHSITGMTAEDSFKTNVHNVPFDVCVRKLRQFKAVPKPLIVGEEEYMLEEVVHDFRAIRNGVYGTGSF